jgi:alpha-galactosidase
MEIIKELKNGKILSKKIKGKPGKVKVFEEELSDNYILINNWQSWGPTKVIPKDFKLNISKEFLEKARFSPNPNPELLLDYIVSDYFIATKDKLYGFLSSKIGHPYFLIKDGKIEGYIDYFEEEFEDYIETEPLAVLNGNIDMLLREYGELLRDYNKPQFKDWNPVGWSSWYYYFENLTWDDVLKNLKLAKNYPFEVFQIDDSWQKDIGDWQPKESFPSLKEMAGTIRKFGFVPGIWLAPFSVSETSSIFKEHKDWLVKDDAGNPKVAYQNWGKNIYALDLSNPDVLDFIETLFKSLKDSGFEYFKIDFLFAGAIPGKRYQNISPIRAYRLGMEKIRKTVSDNFILGCGAPLLPSIGYVDGMRIGPDTAPYYDPKIPDNLGPNAYSALRNTITRYFMNKKLWWNDPDCLLLRKTETNLTTNQKKMFAITAGMLDNMILVSDDLELELDDFLIPTALKLKDGEYFVEGIMDKAFTIYTKNEKVGEVKFRICLETEKSEYYPDKDFLKGKK